MTNTEKQHIQKVKFSDKSEKDIIISYSKEEKYITLKNTNSSAYSKNDYVLKQYRFYNYTQSVIISNGDNHKDYLLNASILLNYAIEEFKLGWKNDSYYKDVLIERYYNPLIKKTNTIADYNTLPEYAMLKKTCKDVLTNVPFYIGEIIKKMIYFSIYNIQNDGTFLPIEIVKKTLKTFDCYENFKHAGGTANLNNVVLDGLFFEYITDNMNNFVDEIETKISIDTGLFYELKKDFTKPLRIIENIYDGEYKQNLDLKFFYDTTITEGSVNSGLDNLIIKFNTLAGNYKKGLDTFGKSLTQAKIDEFQSKTLNLIISDSSESPTFIEDLIGSNSTNADKLSALKILLQFHNKVDNKEFAVRTFETFDTFKQIVDNTDSIEQAYDKIEEDLHNISSDNGQYTSKSQFLYEFKEIIKKLYETLIPASFKKRKIDGWVNFSLGDAFPSKYDILASTELDIDYYTELEEAYKNAKEEYARLYRVDPKSKEAEEILKKVCSLEYSNENSFGANWTNEKPDFNLKEYESIVYRYLYYTIFEPEDYSNTSMPTYDDSGKKHRGLRERDDVIAYFSKCCGLNIVENFKTNSSAETFYNYMKEFIIIGVTEGPFFILIRLVMEDFRQFAESKIKDDEIVREKKAPKVELVEILPNGFSQKYKILVDKGEDSKKLEGLLVEWNGYLAEYEGIIESKDEDEIKKFEKSFLSPWEGRDGYLLEGKVFKTQPTRDDKSAFIKNLSFFYIYSDTNKIPETNLNNYEIDQETESIHKHYRRKQTGVNAVTPKSNGNGRILISGKNYDVKELHTLFKKLASDVLKSTEIDVIEKLRVIEADELREEQKKLYNKYLTEIKNRVSLEKQFFFLEDMLKKKTIPTIPAIDIEFRDEYVDKKGEEKTNWVSVSRMRSDKTNSNLVDETSVSGNELYGYNYFENMTLEDTGGKKEISLTLKGIEDLNLEKIIYNSLTRPVKKFNETFWKKGYTKNADTIQKINDYRVSNFRVRFGYNDTTYENSAINETNINSVNFSNRIKNDKPVVKSPWLYFLINKLDTNFVDGETVFEVGGVNIGNYVLENYRIYNPASNSGSFSFNDMTAVGAIGKIADIFFRASNKTICILSGDSDKIIVNSEYNIKNKIYEHKYATINFKGNKKNVLKKSDFDFQGFSMETQAGVKKDTSNFTIEPGEKEESDGSKERNLPTAQQVLDALINFLPTKLYIAPTYLGNESFMATPVEKTFDNMVKSLAKELRISYDIVEAETQIDSNITEFKDSEWKRRSFIRLYYKGPISRNEEKDEKIRFYKYRGGNESVIKSISIQNPLDLQKISGVVCGFENTKKARIFMSQVGVTPENIGGVGSKVEILMDENETIGPMLVHKGSTTTTNTDGSEAISNISKIANSLTDYTYTGNMEILGDPYYIFDDDLEPFRHKIYLKVNRYKNINLQELADGNYDYYSGLYVVKNITHKLDSGGSFTTNLGLMKFTMASKSSNNKENEQGN